MGQRVAWADEAFAEAGEAQRKPLTLLTLKSHSDYGKRMAAAALILMNDQLGFFEADEQQEEVCVGWEFRAFMRGPQVGEGELTHPIDAWIILESLSNDATDHLLLEVQRLAEIREHLCNDRDELLEACPSDAAVVVFRDVKVSINQLMVCVGRRKLAEKKKSQLELHQWNVRLALRIKHIPQQVAQDWDDGVQVEVLVLDVEARLFIGEEDVMNDVAELARAYALLWRSSFMLRYDWDRTSERNAEG